MSNMAKVRIDGYPDFTVAADRVPELIEWLSANGSQLENKAQPVDGNTLLNEQEKAPPASGPNDNVDPMDPNSKGKAWDFGTKWI
jgi:hypothetical protein